MNNLLKAFSSPFKGDKRGSFPYEIHLHHQQPIGNSVSTNN